MYSDWNISHYLLFTKSTEIEVKDSLSELNDGNLVDIIEFIV